MKISKMLKNGIFKTFKVSTKVAKELAVEVEDEPAVIQINKNGKTQTYILHTDEVYPQDAIMNCEPIRNIPNSAQNTIEKIYLEAELSTLGV